MIAIAEEGPGHHAAVAALHRAAFGGPDEADLVERRRRDDLVAASLVALEDGGVVIGHVLFSDLPVEVDGAPVRAVSLAPMAVRPDRQGCGIGTRLVAEGLPILRERGRGPPWSSSGTSGTTRGSASRPSWPASWPRRSRARPSWRSSWCRAPSRRAGSVRYPAAFGVA